ncbi:hypothetical protein J4Q44_G00010190 [Coregonus suidteri]|uniref:Uncharacterized protein n=1 Tax=Coregonus suidteri TaxID=861788 RepID=A0AAN8NJF3_9TELE
MAVSEAPCTGAEPAGAACLPPSPGPWALLAPGAALEIMSYGRYSENRAVWASLELAPAHLDPSLKNLSQQIKKCTTSSPRRKE